jgi:hypothetical protein
MPKIRSLDAVVRKYGDVTPQRASEYVAGVTDPLNDWKANTTAAVSNYNLGIAASLANKSFDKGVAKTSTEKWKSKAISKGGQRYGPGVTDGVPDYSAGFAPYRDVISNTSLPARYPKGDPRNIERVRVMAAALRAKKMAG